MCFGQPIAYVGHKVQCPLCKGAFPIIEGVLTTTFYGKGVALAGMKTACGAVLIATQFTDTVEWSTGAGASHGVAASTAAALATGMAATGLAAAPVPKAFDEQYAFVDENKQALYEMPCTARLPSGELFHGFTDLEGRTKRFVTDGAQQIEIEIGHHSS